MGVWSNGGPSATSVDVAGIAAAMRPALYAWFTARLQIWDLRRPNAAPEMVADTGENGALIQPLRAPSSIDFGGQPSNLLGIRFQVKKELAIEPGQRLRSGLVVKVIDGGEADGLEALTFSLPETVDSSLAWGRIFEASVVATGS